MNNSRVNKSITNIKIGSIFFILSLFLSFFSRKIFLENLGSEFLGLTGTLNSILSFLNLAELGIGVSISYFLFEPIQKSNKEKICEILSVFGYLYNRIGIVIAIIGLLLSLSFPLIFNNSNIDIMIVYLSFYAFLGSSLIGYFINYRQILLSADQKNYIISIYFQTFNIIKTALQIFIAYKFKNLYLWIILEFVFSIIGCIFLNIRINKEYPWLKTSTEKGKEIINSYPEILSKTKQVFIHRIKDFMLNKSDEILIFAFVSLKMVAFYGNYTMILNKIIYLINIISDGMGAGVGNLVAEGNKKNTIKVFWELMALRFYIVGVVIFTLYLFVQTFIAIWLGKEYILNDLILYLLLFNLFIMLSRGVVEMYIHSYGLFADVWVAWAELLINISITLIAGSLWGITGILLGKIISSIFIAFFWKPYYLFKSGIKLHYSVYWKGISTYYLVFFICLIIITPIKYYIIDLYVDNFIKLFIFAFVILIPIIIIYFIMLYKATEGMKYFVLRFPILSKILN